MGGPAHVVWEERDSAQDDIAHADSDVRQLPLGQLVQANRMPDKNLEPSAHGNAEMKVAKRSQLIQMNRTRPWACSAERSMPPGGSPRARG